MSLAPPPVPVPASTSIGRFGIAWSAALVIYSVVRALIVAPTLGPYGVNPWVFLALDVGCAFPLASGQVSVVIGFRRRDPGLVQRSVAVVAAAFLVPYLYLLLGAGKPLPAVAYALIAALVFGLGAATIWKLRSEAVKARALVARPPT